MGYQNQAVKSVGYGIVSKAFTRGIGIVKISILARILTPSQFGLFGIGALILSLLETLTQSGIEVFLVKEKNKLQDYINTAWVISIVRGIAIGMAIYAGSGLILRFFNEPKAEEILHLIAWVPIIKGFANPALIKFRRELEFGKEFSLRSALFFIESVVAIVATIITRSPVGIVYGILFGAIVEAIFSFVVMRPRPGFEFSPSRFREIFKAGKWLNITGITGYIANEGDDFFVGRMLQTSALGLYQNVYKIAILPLTEIAQIASHVTLPVYSKIEGDRKRLRRAFLRSFVALSMPVVIFGSLIYFFSYEIVLILLGNQWLTAVPVLKILAMYGVVKSFVNISRPLLFAVNKENVVAKLTIVEMITLLIIIVPFINKYGLIGAAYASLASAIVTIPYLVIQIRNSLNYNNG